MKLYSIPKRLLFLSIIVFRINPLHDVQEKSYKIMQKKTTKFYLKSLKGSRLSLQKELFFCWGQSYTYKKWEKNCAEFCYLSFGIFIMSLSFKNFASLNAIFSSWNETKNGEFSQQSNRYFGCLLILFLILFHKFF